jgi:hypothetical protein
MKCFVKWRSILTVCGLNVMSQHNMDYYILPGCEIIGIFSYL